MTEESVGVLACAETDAVFGKRKRKLHSYTARKPLSRHCSGAFLMFQQDAHST
jgi:hypothetical protein